MPQFLYQLKPSRLEMLSEGATEQEEITVGEHFAYLQRLTEQQIVLLAGRTLVVDDGALGLVIIQASDEAEAHSIMQNDPAVLNQVMTATLLPFRVALWSENGLTKSTPH